MNLNNARIIAVLTSAVFFFCPAAFFAQQIENEDNKTDAVIKPLEPYGGFIRKLEKGEQVWTDREEVFAEIPESLEGKGYIWSPMNYSEAMVKSSGYVYVITPTPVPEHVRGRFSISAAGRVIPYFQSLAAMGFQRMEDIHEFKISESIKEPVAVYRKYAQKGEIIKYGRPSWGVTLGSLPEDLKELPGEEESFKKVFNNPPEILLNPEQDYAFESRTYQGVPSIEITPEGRLWAAWVACNCGVYTEGPRNYTVLVSSNDQGITWSDPPVLAVQHKVWPIGCIDPMLWHDPLGRMWYVWTNRDTVIDVHNSWRIMTAQSEKTESLSWSEPEKIGEGTQMNKPTVLSTGEWLFFSSERGSPVDIYISRDEGKTISHFSQANVPRAGWNEHMVIERKDGSLWMLVRRAGGIAQSFSYDRGKTWTEGELYRAGPSSRFHIRRLKSGRLLLIFHPEEEGVRMRTNLTAYLSEDEGKTWPYELLLDSREWVSYPDAVESKNGFIYSVHDHHRPSKMQIVMSVFTEEDIIAGKLVNENSRLGVIISGKE